MARPTPAPHTTAATLTASTATSTSATATTITATATRAARTAITIPAAAATPPTTIPTTATIPVRSTVMDAAMAVSTRSPTGLTHPATLAPGPDPTTATSDDSARQRKAATDTLPHPGPCEIPPATSPHPATRLRVPPVRVVQAREEAAAQATLGHPEIPDQIPPHSLPLEARARPAGQVRRRRNQVRPLPHAAILQPRATTGAARESLNRPGNTNDRSILRCAAHQTPRSGMALNVHCEVQPLGEEEGPPSRGLAPPWPPNHAAMPSRRLRARRSCSRLSGERKRRRA